MRTTGAVTPAADIAEQHGGRLVAGNRPGGGAVFTLELPRWRAG